MVAKALKLMVFAHLDQAWAPCGQLLLTEEGTNVLVSSFAYGLNYARRADALEVDPVVRRAATPSHASERYLHLGIGPQGRLATLDNALAAHEQFTLSRTTACALIAEVWRVVRQWRVNFEDFGVPAAEIEKIAPAFRHIDDVSTPALRKHLP